MSCDARTDALNQSGAPTDISAGIAAFAHAVEAQARRATSPAEASAILTAGLAELRAAHETTRLTVSALESSYAALRLRGVA